MGLRNDETASRRFYHRQRPLGDAARSLRYVGTVLRRCRGGRRYAHGIDLLQGHGPAIGSMVAVTPTQTEPTPELLEMPVVMPARVRRAG
jgi:hypothetical protein